MKRWTLLLIGITIGFASLLPQSVAAQQPRFKKLQQFKKLQMIEYLDLDDKTAEKFFVVYNRWQKKVEALRKKIRRLSARLREAVHLDDKEAVKRYNTELVAAQKELNRAIEQSLAEIRKVLGEEKFAKFLIFEARFREAVKKLRKKQHSPAPPR